MRNWYTETQSFDLLMLKSILSDITYEELIRIHIIHSKVFIKDFILSDITYEELIRTAGKRQSCQNKPERRTLPMRNWYLFGLKSDLCNLLNYKSDITYEELIHTGCWICPTSLMWKHVGHYLWGIDTQLCGRSLSASLQTIVGHYLWGIDTL